MGETDAEILERARTEWYWSGAMYDFHYATAVRALELAPEDPVVVARCLSVGHRAIEPSPHYTDETRAMVRRALELGERMVPSRDGLDTVAARVLAFWVDHLRAFAALRAESVTPETLVSAQARLDSGFALLNLPALGDEEEQYDRWFRVEVLARRRAWEMVLAGPPYPAEAIERMTQYLCTWDRCGHAPVAPLTRDATFRAFARKVLAERTASKAHVAPAGRSGLFVKQLAEEGAPSRDELEGRWLLQFWLRGIDQDAFLNLCQQGIEDHPASLAHLLAYGFDPNAHLDDGNTLLHQAVREGKLEAVKLLVAAGANPHLRAKRGKRETARKLAEATKKKAIIAALDGTVAAPPTALYDALRAAAKTVDIGSLQFIASMYGLPADRIDPVGAVENVLAKAPDTVQQIVDGVGGGFPFDRYLILHILRAAGHKQDVRLRGATVLEDALNVTGDLIVDGVLVDELGDTSAVVAGDLVVHGLVTNADCIVGGNLRARDFVWGDYNDGSLAVAGDIATPLLVMTDHSYEAAGNEQIEKQFEDAGPKELAAIFVPEVLDDGSVDRDRVIARLHKGQPIILGLAAKKAAKKKVAKKKVAKKKPLAKKKPAAKKKPTATKRLAATKTPAARKPGKKAHKSRKT